jgi:hypothetical protein
MVELELERMPKEQRELDKSQMEPRLQVKKKEEEDTYMSSRSSNKLTVELELERMPKKLREK